MSVVMSQPNVLKLVLSNLSAKEILSAPVIVSRFWNEVSLTLLNNRHGFSVSAMTSEEGRDEAHLPAIDSFISQSSFVPKKTLILTSEKLLPSAKYIRESSKKIQYNEVSTFSMHKMMSFYIKRELMHSNCELYAVSAQGVFALSNRSEISADEVDVLTSASVMFSKHFSENISFFSIPQTLTNEESITRDLLRSSIGCPNTSDIKFMFYLSAQHGLFPTQLLESILDLEPNIAISGALIEKHVLYDADCCSKVTPDCVTGMAIFGDNIRASSVVLDQECTDENDIKDSLQKFSRSVGKLSRNSLAVFAFCVGRDMELDVKYFKMFFEGLQAIGVYGHGEFGRDVVRGVCSDRSQEFVHAYSTVITIIDFEPPEE